MLNVHLGDDGSDARRQALMRYLRTLHQHCHVLPLAAMGGEEGTSQEVSLDQVYVALDTTTRVPLTAAEKAQRKNERADRPDREADERPLTALEAATQTQRLVLLGDPGSGKTTFVRQLAAWLAATALGEAAAPAGWASDLLPLVTTLRDLAPVLAQVQFAGLASEQQSKALAGAVEGFWQAELGEPLADVLDAALVSGKVLLVFDGLDEVSEPLRPLVRQALKALSEQHPAIARMVVTCRIRSYVGAAVLPGFTAHTLARFDDEKVPAFVAAWYRAQFNLGRMNEATVQERTADLQRATRSGDLQELASNPMLLTTMAIIHQREIGLPKERVRLYDRAVAVLLSQWQRRKGGGPSPRLDKLLNDDLKLRTVMERLALAAHEQRQSSETDLSRAKLLVLLDEPAHLGDVGLAQEFLDYVDQRAGLLIGRGGGEGRPQSYTFPHRTFQEYLAGCALMIGARGVRRSYWARAGEGDAWHLAAQLGAEELLYNRRNEEMLLDLMYDLCAERAPTDERGWRAVLWSAHMAALVGLATVRRDVGLPEGGAAYAERIVARLLTLLAQSALNPLERAEAGRLLAQLGDPRPEVMTVDGMQLCFVPPGPFLRTDEGNSEATVDYPFWMGRYPVTNAQFGEFAAAGGYGKARYWPEAAKEAYWTEAGYKVGDNARMAPYDLGEPYSLPNHPVVGVSWYEALAFCRWLTERWRTARWITAELEVRLPTELEWEKAARGGIEIPADVIVVAAEKLGAASAPTLKANPQPQRLYAWSDGEAAQRANWREAGISATSAAGCFRQSADAYGVEELNGNLWEWSMDDYLSQYKLLFGGAFYSDADKVSSSARSLDHPRYGDGYFGFRVVVVPLSR